jgi:alkylhydroperoxidase family enzyme
MAHAETCHKPVMKLGGTPLGKLQLDAKLRELCLLQAARIAGGAYEWMQHVPIALDRRATQAQIDALSAGSDGAPCCGVRELSALVFTRELVAKGKALPAGAERGHADDPSRFTALIC